MRVRLGPFVFVALVALGCSTVRAQERKSLVPKDGLECLLVNRNSGRCLSVAEKSDAPGARIVQGPTPDQAGPSERWTLVAADKAYRLKNAHSGLVLEIGNANLNKGVQPIQWHDHKTRTNQHWTFEAMDNAYVLRAEHSQFVLAIGQSKMEEGARAIQWPYHEGLADQLWELHSTKDEPPPVVAPPEASPAMPWWIVGAVAGLAFVFLIVAAIAAFLLLRRRRDSASEPEEAAEAGITTPCTGCGRVLKVKPSMVGKKVRCARCGQTVRVPAE